MTILSLLYRRALNLVAPDFPTFVYIGLSASTSGYVGLRTWTDVDQRRQM